MLVTDAEPDRFAPLAPPAPLGLRGVWVVRRAVRQPLADAIQLENGAACAPTSMGATGIRIACRAAGLRVTGEHREGGDTSAANQGAMAVLAKASA